MHRAGALGANGGRCKQTCHIHRVKAVLLPTKITANLYLTSLGNDGVCFGLPQAFEHILYTLAAATACEVRPALAAFLIQAWSQA